MLHISIISSKKGFQYKSYRASLYFKKYLEEKNIATADILDTENFNYLQRNTDLKRENKITEKNRAAEKIRGSDGIIIVSPVCDEQYPEIFKRIIQLLNENWSDKPIAIATVCTGPFHRSQLVVFLRLMLWKIMRTTIPAFRGFPKEIEAYDKNGNANNKVLADKHSAIFVNKLLHHISTVTDKKTLLVHELHQLYCSTSQYAKRTDNTA